MEKPNNFLKSKTALAIGIFIVGYLSCLVIDEYYFDRCSNKYDLVNPDFACQKVGTTINKKEYIDLKTRLLAEIDEETKKGTVNTIAVFFRDLKGGPTMGINDRDKFIPASLLKLPVVLTIFRYAEEEDPEMLSQPLMYSNDVVLQNTQEFPPEKLIKPNTPYTVMQLIESTLEYSDNFAVELLDQHIEALGNGEDLVADTFIDLGIINTKDLNSASVSAKGYSSIFRMLFNSSFLSLDDSEKILQILSQNNFVDGLKAGVPENIKVANKFGEREITATGEKQLHDCGIIYYPDNPYTLCVMTKGKDMKELKKIISHISKEVYNEVDSRRIID